MVLDDLNDDDLTTTTALAVSKETTEDRAILSASATKRWFWVRRFQRCTQSVHNFAGQVNPNLCQGHSILQRQISRQWYKSYACNGRL